MNNFSEDGTYSARLEIIFNTVLEPFPLHLHGCNDKRVTKEVGGVAYTFVCMETEKIKLFLYTQVFLTDLPQ